VKLNNLLVLNQKGKQVTGIKKQQKTRQRPDLFLNLLFPDFSVTVKDTLPLEKKTGQGCGKNSVPEQNTTSNSWGGRRG